MRISYESSPSNPNFILLKYQEAGKIEKRFISNPMTFTDPQLPGVTSWK
jgi:hypothetical protein